MRPVAKLGRGNLLVEGVAQLGLLLHRQRRLKRRALVVGQALGYLVGVASPVSTKMAELSGWLLLPNFSMKSSSIPTSENSPAAAPAKARLWTSS